MKEAKEKEEEEDEQEWAHSGCQPASLRLHETLMDLIDWQEHRRGLGWAERGPGSIAARKNKSVWHQPGEIRSTQSLCPATVAYQGTIKREIVSEDKYAMCGRCHCQGCQAARRWGEERGNVTAGLIFCQKINIKTRKCCSCCVNADWHGKYSIVSNIPPGKDLIAPHMKMHCEGCLAGISTK